MWIIVQSIEYGKKLVSRLVAAPLRLVTVTLRCLKEEIGCVRSERNEHTNLFFPILWKNIGLLLCSSSITRLHLRHVAQEYFFTFVAKWEFLVLFSFTKSFWHGFVLRMNRISIQDRQIKHTPTRPCSTFGGHWRAWQWPTNSGQCCGVIVKVFENKLAKPSIDYCWFVQEGNTATNFIIRCLLYTPRANIF